MSCFFHFSESNNPGNTHRNNATLSESFFSFNKKIKSDISMILKIPFLTAANRLYNGALPLPVYLYRKEPFNARFTPHHPATTFA